MLDLRWLALFTLALWLVLAVWWARGIVRVPRLERARSRPADAWPRVSVIVPARNEEDTVEEAMESLLALDYPGLEIVAVDDRSEDRTPEVLAALARRDTRLRVHRVDALPDGWLGKTHALASGARLTAGEWLLFTDADVHFRPNALRAAIDHAERHRLDHLAALPRFVARGPLVGSFMTAFALLFTFYTRIWEVGDPASDAAIGIGAFTLVRRDAYRSAGGHRRVRMRPDDDLALGRVLKRSGARQGVAFASDALAVAWYPDVRSAVRGMRKNAFAGFDFSVPLTIGAAFVLLLTNVWPFVAVFVTSGAARLAYLGVLVLVGLVYALYARMSGAPAGYAVLHPLGVACLVWASLGSAARALWHGGIEWRGTTYPLEAIREADRTDRRDGGG